MTTKYRIKSLAQELPKSTQYIKPGIYESLDKKVIEYQTKLGNLIEIKVDDNYEVKQEESTFSLKLNIEEDSQTEKEETPKEPLKRTYKRKSRRNINDNSN